MSVLIKSMEMPKSCYDCYFCRTYDEPNQGYFCIPLFADLHRTDFTKKRIDACPLIEVPTPHDDLIGRETAKKTVCRALEVNCKNLMNTAVPMLIDYALNNAPTIIEAEPPESGEA